MNYWCPECDKEIDTDTEITQCPSCYQKLYEWPTSTRPTITDIKKTLPPPAKEESIHSDGRFSNKTKCTCKKCPCVCACACHKCLCCGGSDRK